MALDEDDKFIINKEFLEILSPMVENEVSIYKLALDLYNQGSEIGFAIHVAKKTMGMDE
jgi:hypothetical protein